MFNPNGGIMNIKLLISVGLLAIAFASAQYYDEDEDTDEVASEGVEETYAPAPMPVAVLSSSSSAPVSSSSYTPLADFNRLRGNAYNAVGNHAAPFTIGDYKAMPHLFSGNQLLYIEPTGGANGIVSWGKSTTLFVGLDNSGSLGLITAGIAQPTWGLALNIALGQLSITEDNGTNSTTTSVTEDGDRWGAVFSMPAGGGIFAASADWITTQNQTSISDNVTRNNWSLLFNAGYSNSPKTATDIAWLAGIEIFRHVDSEEPDGGQLSVSPDTRTEITPYFNLGAQILGHERARVLIGSNNRLMFQLFDGYDNPGAEFSHIEFGLILSPNFLAELALTKDFMLFGGATHDFLLFGYKSETATTKGVTNVEVSESALQSKTYGTTVSMGARYQKESFAVEATLSERLFSDTNEWFNGTNTIISLGGFIYF